MIEQNIQSEVELNFNITTAENTIKELLPVIRKLEKDLDTTMILFNQLYIDVPKDLVIQLKKRIGDVRLKLAKAIYVVSHDGHEPNAKIAIMLAIKCGSLGNKHRINDAIRYSGYDSDNSLSEKDIPELEKYYDEKYDTWTNPLKETRALN